MQDSVVHRGGSIPGGEGRAAFTLSMASPSPVPILIAVPHAGRHYPAALLDRMRYPAEATLKLEDRYVDRLAEAIARQTGAALLVAHAPRAMVDLNRAVEDMDWEMLDRAERPRRSDFNCGRRARSGLGLVPRRLPGMGELWKERIGLAELDARLDQVHRPYHQALSEALTALRKRWGAALLLDLHSMPPLSGRAYREPVADLVVGDRFGASCDGNLCAVAFKKLGRHGWKVAHNRPYAGGYVLDRHTAPGRCLHGFQLEICRSIYLDSGLKEPGPGFANIAAHLADLVRHLAGEVAALGRGMPLAAE
jgi:N-formylglutamate amidohydrolase